MMETLLLEMGAQGYVWLIQAGSVPQFKGKNQFAILYVVTEKEFLHSSEQENAMMEIKYPAMDVTLIVKSKVYISVLELLQYAHYYARTVNLILGSVSSVTMGTT